jgi:hypothetical protein
MEAIGCDELGTFSKIMKLSKFNWFSIDLHSGYMYTGCS